MNIYRDHAPLYYDAGWAPLPITTTGAKSPVPKGFTGKTGMWPTQEQVVTWQAKYNGERTNAAVRLPDTVIGIDVDAYRNNTRQKNGAETLAKAVDLWGPLPDTYISTARRESGDEVSGIRFFRVPAGTVLDESQFPMPDGCEQRDIEIIQFGHRYGVVWPSVHPDTGTMYRWYSPEGVVAVSVPKVDDLPEFPGAWLRGLKKKKKFSGMTFDDLAAISAPTAKKQEKFKSKVKEHQEMFAGLSEGERDDAIFLRLCKDWRRYAQMGITADDARLPLQKLALTYGELCKPPFTEQEAMQKAEQALKQDRSDVQDSTMMPSPNVPTAVAQMLVQDYTSDDGVLTLRHWRGAWMAWQQTHWSEIDVATIRSGLYKRLENSVYFDGDKVKQWAPNRTKIANVLEALAALVHLEAGIESPAWLGGCSELPPPAEVIACTNGLLHVTTRKLVPLTPEYFNVASVPFDYDATAPVPTRWLTFLESLWPDNSDEITVLQDYIGYILSAQRHLQKMLMIVGPKRSGKGTIERTLINLVGEDNARGVTASSLASNFGLSPLIGKPLAIMGDARVGSGHTAAAAVEKLLSITGEDIQTIDRKFSSYWTGRLPTRFLLLSNELPMFGDASGAIASRFLVLTLTRSWLGNEDYDLDRDLAKELPGILLWALDGLDNLTKRSRFLEPESSRDAVEQIADLASPESAFVREWCEVGSTCEERTDDVYELWKYWCQENGGKVGEKSTLGRNLRAVYPTITPARHRVNGRIQNFWHGVGFKEEIRQRFDAVQNGDSVLF